MQATTVQAPAPAPAAVAAPPAPAAPPDPTGNPTVVVTNADGTTQYLPIPLTRQDVENIRERRSELSDQLTSAAGRRRRLAEELIAQPAGPARAGIEGRLVVLDRRLAQLESDIAATGRQLTAAAPGLVEQEWVPPRGGDMPENVMIVINVFTIFVLFPLAFAFARNLWKRGNRAAAAPAPPENRERLERLEQGVEAIAIEVERISEGQRFVTKLLSEGSPAVRLPESQRVAEKA